MTRRFFRWLFRWLFRLCARLEVQGVENIPAQGGALLAANHLSRLDAPLVFMLIERDDLTGLVADKYKRNAFFSWLVRQVDGIWLNRESADFAALRQASEYLRQGGLLGIAPEGTRSQTGALAPAKTGVAYLAEKAGAPIVPVAIAGSERFFSELKRLRRARIQIRIGPAFRLAPLERGERSEGLQRNTDEIMCQIAARLPEAYWGAYAGHPRLQELTTLEPQMAGREHQTPMSADFKNF